MEDLRLLNIYTAKNLSAALQRRATLIKEIKASTENVLTLDAGDTVQGSMFFNLFNGLPDVKMMSEIGYDVIVLGNHEFDKGITMLEELVSVTDVPYVSSNIKFLKNKNLAKMVQDYVIKDFDGFKVAIVGVTTDELKH
ncbi:MAG: hypothetical protein MZV70_70105 [Desulfobacterales bacterium]|nr:hypothetical protein [Desulfobacterales bacterium]